jgi:hypothetical protein
MQCKEKPAIEDGQGERDGRRREGRERGKGKESIRGVHSMNRGELIGCVVGGDMNSCPGCGWYVGAGDETTGVW